MTTRRSFILGTAAALAAPTVRAASARPTATACVVLYMHGGASQFETFDPKPGTQSGGPTRALATTTGGVRFAEHLPELARRAHHLALLRTVTMREGSHDRARYLMRSGHTPQGGVAHPGLAALVSARHGRPDAIGAVAIGPPTHAPGLLGPRHAALTVRRADDPMRSLGPDLDTAEQARDRSREALLVGLQSSFARGRDRAMVDAHTETFARARALLRSPQRVAFDLDDEPAARRDRYGDSTFGRGCLLARRLVDHDVPFVEVGLQGWDTHEDHFARTEVLARQLDGAMAALVDDLAASGRLAQTLVVCMGDFGRTPAINGRGGRDHFPACNTVVLAGGGIEGGVAVGRTTDDGREIAERPIAIADLYATLCARLGIDPDEVRTSPSGRPITTVDGGVALAELA